MFTTSSPIHDSENDCSVVGENSHEWCPQQPGDVRSPCPALNTLANHGYLPRDGKQLTPAIMIQALQEGYGLSTPLAYLLVYGGTALLGQAGAFGLDDLARHNRIEHDASLVHNDTPDRDEYAPISPDAKLVGEFLHRAEDGQIMTVEDVARARVERESQCPVLNGLHAEIARGEMAIALGLFSQTNSDQQGIPLDMLRIWLSEERLPDGWKPTHTQGLLQTIRASRQIRTLMTKFKDEDAAHEEHA
ncbi:Chloroperoxidase [Multifurca ochricompacta]|uniref:Chloroperoxidase n=1 Tax=Multifurca ochricompacta TaxID=376703 RepID=A0AAD4QKS2_9AGAM|nr:Chloroperoxidase [Multifurca ochricompacta]